VLFLKFTEGRNSMGAVFEDEILKTAREVKLLILDVDGVLTDGSIILDNNENEYKMFHVRDGHGIKMLIRAGIKVALITGRYSRVVERRANELGISDVFQKCFDKRVPYRQLAEKYSANDQEIAYVGDDLVDIPVMKKCGFSVTVSDAEEEVKAHASMITKRGGGKGAVREVCDLLLIAKGIWRDIIDEYTQT
jgi:3-deoxy-D-manno-octulosonate 8-phosphate phosphatase (KDO 8-P phosphatase)